MSFETIKEFYELGLWNKDQITELMKAGVITIKQYEEIVGTTN